MDDYKQLLMAIATMDVKRLRQLIRTALNRHASATQISWFGVMAYTSDLYLTWRDK